MYFPSHRTHYLGLYYKTLEVKRDGWCNMLINVNKISPFELVFFQPPPSKHITLTPICQQGPYNTLVSLQNILQNIGWKARPKASWPIIHYDRINV